MRKGATILIIIGVILIAFLALAAIGGSSEKPVDARYNYEYEYCDSFIGKDGQVVKPYDETMRYVVVKVKAVNNRISSGLSTNSLTWMWHVRCGDVQYSTCLDMYNHPLYKLEDIAKGGSDTFAYVFKIPKTAKVTEVTQKYGPGYNIVLDKTIVI